MQHICIGYAPHMNTLRRLMCHDSITSDVLVCTIAITHSYCALMYAEHINESWHLISFNHCNTHCSTLQHTLLYAAHINESWHPISFNVLQYAAVCCCGTYQRVMASNLIQSGHGLKGKWGTLTGAILFPSRPSSVFACDFVFLPARRASS